MNRKEYVMQPKLRMDAYYFGFSATGVREIDEILSAVACAGKAYHHTERWNDADEGEWSYAELIQHAATRAAARIAELEQRLKPFADRASTDTVQDADKFNILLVITNGKRMCAIDPKAFVEARTTLEASEHKKGQRHD